MKIKSDTLIVIAFILFGLAFRLIGIRHGLPGLYHPDEPVVVSRAIDLILNGKWNPQFFHWPPFLIYLLALEYKIIYLIGHLFGQFKDSEDFFRFYLLNRGEFHYYGRLLIAVMGCLTGLYIFNILRLSTNALTAFIGLVITEIAFLFFKHSQYITPDIPAVLTSTIALYCLFRFFVDPSKSRQIYNSALFIGLASSFKYNYVVMFALIIYAIFSFSLLKNSSRIRILFNSLLITIFTILILNPFIIIDSKTFWFQIGEISLHFKEGHIGMESGGLPFLSLFSFIFKSSNWLFCLLSLLGIFALYKTSMKLFGLLLIHPILILLSHCVSPVTADRYALPLYVYSVILACFGIYFIQSAFQKKYLCYAICLVLMIQLIYPSLLQSSENLKIDTREVARLWIEANVPSGSKLGIEKNGPTLQHNRSAYYREPAFLYYEIIPWFGESFRSEDPLKTILTNKPEYVITNSVVWSRYLNYSGGNQSFMEISSIWKRYYNSLDKYCELALEVKPSDKYTGPEVKVYRIPELSGIDAVKDK